VVAAGVAAGAGAAAVGGVAAAAGGAGVVSAAGGVGAGAGVAGLGVAGWGVAGLGGAGACAATCVAPTTKLPSQSAHDVVRAHLLIARMEHVANTKACANTNDSAHLRVVASAGRARPCAGPARRGSSTLAGTRASGAACPEPAQHRNLSAGAFHSVRCRRQAPPDNHWFFSRERPLHGRLAPVPATVPGPCGFQQ
jgi:hypothetical protein